MATRLWVLKRRLIEGVPVYDCNDGFVIRAVDSSEARLIASRAFCDEGPNAWLSTETSTCEEILQSGDVGIILRDFNAG